MSQQSKLNDDNFYPEVVEEDGEEVVRFDPNQIVTCKRCGQPMELMSPGPTGNIKRLVNNDYEWSCRTPWCGIPHSEGGPKAGGSTHRALVTEDKELIVCGGIGESEVTHSDEFIDNPELGPVHSKYFDPEQYEEAKESED